MSQAFQKLIAILACVAILGVVILLQKPESTPEADKAPLARWVFEKASADGKTIADLKEKFPLTLRGKPHFITTGSGLFRYWSMPT